MTSVQDRDALYYPYIHIRDLNWLKGTLLCFPQVRRIVPSNFYLNDSEEVQQFMKVKGPRGEPLLTQEYTDYFGYDSDVHHAQIRLLEVLRENAELFRERYSQEAALKDFGNAYDSFEMHAGKLLVELHDYLMETGLGWYTGRIRDENSENRWVALHPMLGEAVMSVLAIAIAKERKLDIVTISGRVHHSLAVQDENEVLDTLLGKRVKREEVPVGEKVDELAEIVLTTTFDLSRLDAEQIAELVKEGKDLRAFKNSLVPLAEELPDIPDPVERQKRLREKGKEVIAAWEAYKNTLPWFAADALVAAGEVSVPALALKVLGAAASPLTFAAGIGLAVGILTYKGIKTIRQYRERAKSPYSYLTRIEKAGASLILPPAALA
jgi:hypothetical protein